MNVMRVMKRNGKMEEVQFDKVATRIKNVAQGLNNVDTAKVAVKTIGGLFDGVSTHELDTLAAETAAFLSTDHFEYSFLAARIATSRLHKNTKDSFSDVIEDMRNCKDSKTGESAALISEEVCNFVQENKAILNSAVLHTRDQKFDFFGFKTLEKSYLMKIDGKIAERPQHLYMRVSVAIHMPNMHDILNSYELLSTHAFTHATPTLFNAGTPRPQMSSCFLMQVKEDSIDGIFKTVADCAAISKNAGGIGVAMSNVRSSGSYIKGTNGESNGIVPMLRVFDATARYVDQGGGKRKGAFAMYIEPHHPDVFEFLDLRKNSGKEELRARDLFLGLWVSDLFMKRVEEDSSWSLFCPSESPGLDEVHGEDYKRLYETYEREGKAKKVLPARKVWSAILDSQVETGVPYMLYKDACNGKSNQKHLGTIKNSNLCTEIVEFVSPDEIAVCNLASISLPHFVEGDEVRYDKIKEVSSFVTKALNRVIDKNFYPVSESKNSNLRHRPIGIGVQGLADVFAMLSIPFESEAAKRINSLIFESIYYGAMSESVALAEQDGPYFSFEGSPLSEGKFQFDLWGRTPSGMFDWSTLREKAINIGSRNSLLLAPMPTASTSQIIGNTEAFEPFSANLYSRRVLAGEFIVVNKHLIKNLQELGLWDEKMKNDIIKNNGSVQSIERVPPYLREVYKTVWEVKMKSLIDMSADRGAFICQSQSFNCFMQNPTHSKLSSMHFYAWKRGLKTGMYYLRSRAAADAIKFTVSQEEDCETCGA